MKIVIFGSNGRVGSALCERLSKTDHMVFPLTRKDADIQDSWYVEFMIHMYKPDVVINCAAFTGVDICEKEPRKTYLTNTAAPTFMAMGCASTDALFIHLSTDCVFNGSPHGTPLLEDTPTDPFGTYGFTKKAAEDLTLWFNKSTWIFRLTNVYGRAFTGPVEAVAQVRAGRGTEDNPIQVIKQFCCPTSARLVADAIVHAIDTKPRGTWTELSGIYNLAASSGMWKKDFAELVLSKFYLDKFYVIKEGSPPVPRPTYMYLDTSKFGRTFDYELPGCMGDLQQSLHLFEAA